MPFAVQLKPVGSACNLRCKYCYVMPFMPGHLTVMDDNVLRRIIASCFAQSTLPTFSWHGGEPLLAGLPLFRQAWAYMQEARQAHHTGVRNLVQTNGTLITEEFAEFMADCGFSVGISLDGTESVHNTHRRYRGGQPSYHDVVRGLHFLQSAGINPWVIATVTQASLPYAAETFNHLLDLGFTDIKFSPVFDTETGEFGIASEQWLAYLTEVFEIWFERENPDTHVRELDEVIAWLNNDTISVCSSNRTCLQWVSVNPDGDLYPCEYFHTDHTYGNILTMELADISSTAQYREFTRTFLHVPDECRSCEYQALCGNGCPATRVRHGKMTPEGVYAYCHQRQMLYTHIKQRFEAVMLEAS